MFDPVVKAVNAGILFSLLLFTTTILAQTPNASQSSLIAAAISSYTASLLRGPVATSIELEVVLAGDIPNSELASIAQGLPTLIPSITSGEDLYSFATDPPVTFATPAWIASLPAAVQSDVEALRTSIVRGEASIVASVLGFTEVAVATGTTTGAAASATTSNAAPGMAERGQLREVAMLAAVFVSGVGFLVAL